MAHGTFKLKHCFLCLSLLLPFVSPAVHGQSLAPPGPLHQRTESQELSYLFGQQTSNKKVANATSLVNIAVDPSNANNTIVLGPSAFYVTSDGGRRWSTDFIPLVGVFGFTDPYSTEPDSEQYATGISFDHTGHTYISLQDPPGMYASTGNHIALAGGTNHGSYLNNQPKVEYAAYCGQFNIPNYCSEEPVSQGIVTDLSGTSSDGSTYLFFIDYCEDNAGPGCPSLYYSPASSEAIAEVVAGPGPPSNSQFFYNGNIVSNYYKYYYVTDASIVVDSTGNPHVIYVDLGQKPTIDLILDQAYSALLQYSPAGKNNPHFSFPGGFAPSHPFCAAHGLTAYCAFNAGSIGNGPAQTNVNVYLATIDLVGQTATAALVNNDPPGKGKDHFNPSVTVTPNGDVYVGFFDDRRDPADQKLDYFLARSVDGGKTFAQQQAINDVSFPDQLGIPPQTQTPSFAGSIASAPDGSVHAAWTDTRNGVSTQVYYREVKW